MFWVSRNHIQWVLKPKVFTNATVRPRVVFVKIGQSLSNIVKNCNNLFNLSLSVNIGKNCKICQKLSNMQKNVVNKCNSCQKLSKLSKIVRSCLLITLIKCLKGQKFLGSLCNVLKPKIVWLSQWVTDWLTQWQSHLLSCQTHLGNSRTTNGLSHVLKSNGVWVTQWVTRSPIELSDSRLDS